MYKLHFPDVFLCLFLENEVDKKWLSDADLWVNGIKLPEKIILILCPQVKFSVQDCFKNLPNPDFKCSWSEDFFI